VEGRLSGRIGGGTHSSWFSSALSRTNQPANVDATSTVWRLGRPTGPRAIIYSSFHALSSIFSLLGTRRTARVQSLAPAKWLHPASSSTPVRKAPE